MLLQVIYLLSSVGFTVLAVIFLVLARRNNVPGGGVWGVGCVQLALTTLLVGMTSFWGDWSRAFGAHVFLAGGFGCLWLGTSLFVGRQLRWYRAVLPVGLMLLMGGGAYYFWRIHPSYQARFTISCVMLLGTSLMVSRALFSDRFNQRIVTIAGVLFIAFAIINGLRTINLIILPSTSGYLLSGPLASLLTLIMMPVLFAALILMVFMARRCESTEDSCL